MTPGEREAIIRMKKAFEELLRQGTPMLEELKPRIEETAALVSSSGIIELLNQLRIEAEGEEKKKAQIDALIASMTSPSDPHQEPEYRRQAGLNQGEDLPTVLDKDWDPGKIGF
jgi:hypothetical protein